MDILSSVVGIFGKVIDRVIPDKNAAAKAKQELDLLYQNGELNLLVAQLEVNKEEAKHSSIFVAGWRPFIGWICGFGLAYNFILYPFLKFLVIVLMNDPPELPILDTDELMTLLLGMLGLVGARSYEKKHGVARNK